MFANKNNPLDSALDGIGMGIGFTLALGCMGLVREVIGAGSIAGIAIPWLSDNAMAIIARAPGGFFVFACAIAAVNYFTKGKGVKGSFDCQGCAMASVCQKDECISALNEIEKKGAEA